MGTTVHDWPEPAELVSVLRKSMTAREIGEAAGCGESYVRRIGRGERQPNWRTWSRLADLAAERDEAIAERLAGR